MVVTTYRDASMTALVCVLSVCMWQHVQSCFPAMDSGRKGHMCL